MSFFSLNHHKDLPLDQDPGTRFLPWLVAFMVYLAALSVVATSMVQAVGKRWEQGVSETLSVQVPPHAEAAVDEKRLGAVLDVLRAHPAVIIAQPMGEDQVVSLLQPWLGDATVIRAMPLPHLIDVSLRPGVEVDGASFSRQLNDLVPGVSVDDHRVWLSRLIQMSQTLQWGAYIVLVLILTATVGTIYFVTKTGLAIHYDVIEVLHLIGAQDSYIARQFAEQAMQLGLKGGFYGLAVAGPTFGIFAYFYRQVDSSLLPQIDITIAQWVAICALPLLAATMGYVSARFAVMKTLKKMV